MRKVLLVFVCTALTFPVFANAQVNCKPTDTTGFVPLACYNGSALQNLYSTQGDKPLANFFNKLFAFSLSIGAILAVVMIVYGGYLYMFKDSFASKLNAKEKITNAVIGLLLLLGVYLILYQINPEILNLNIVFPQSTGGSSAQTTPLDRGMQSINDNDYRTNPDSSVPKLGCYSVSRDLTQCSAGYVKTRGVKTDDDGVTADGAYYYCCPQ